MSEEKKKEHDLHMTKAKTPRTIGCPQVLLIDTAPPAPAPTPDVVMGKGNPGVILG
jgi:hypothetical protein